MKPSATEAEEFRAAIASTLGLHFGDDKIGFLSELLAARTRATGASTTLAYVSCMGQEPGEARELARALTVPETYFFRNPDQFRALEAILRERAKAGPGRLRILSAGCASGEEPYSISIVARDALPDLPPPNLEILAFDLNPDVLARARRGEYSRWSLRETPERLQNECFRWDGRHFAIDGAVRQSVRFEERNLAEPDDRFWGTESFDVVFCRNVLMYFAPEAARESVERITSSLAPDGFLFLGHAENLRGLSRAFRLLHTHDTFYYQKRREPPSRGEESSPRASVPRDLADEVSWVAAIARASDRIEKLTRGAGELDPPKDAAHRPAGEDLGPALRLLKADRYKEALQQLPCAAGASDQDPERLLLRAVLLATSGEIERAEEICAELLTIDELNAGAHHVLALCREHAGDRGGAVEHDQVAVYLDPEFAMPRLHLGLLSRRGGDIASARRELEMALSLFEREDPARIVLFGGGFGRESLVELCRAELRSLGGAER